MFKPDLIPAPLPKPLRPGQSRRFLARQGFEQVADAVARAQLMFWWPAVVEPKPGFSRGRWVWTVDLAAVHAVGQAG